MEIYVDPQRYAWHSGDKLIKIAPVDEFLHLWIFIAIFNALHFILLRKVQVWQNMEVEEILTFEQKKNKPLFVGF